LDQCVHVEDEADPAIAENRAAGQQVLLAECVAETLNHDFLFTEKLIHKQTPGRVAGFDYDDDAILRFDRPRSSPKIVAQTEQRGLPAPHADDFAAPLDGFDSAGRRSEGLPDGQRGNDVTLATYSHQQPVDNGKGQWKEDSKGRALSR
jgi:hypothetical protein